MVIETEKKNEKKNSNELSISLQNVFFENRFSFSDFFLIMILAQIQ